LLKRGSSTQADFHLTAMDGQFDVVK